jgi:hypothetical protein
MYFNCAIFVSEIWQKLGIFPKWALWMRHLLPKWTNYIKLVFMLGSQEIEYSGSVLTISCLPCCDLNWKFNQFSKLVNLIVGKIEEKVICYLNGSTHTALGQFLDNYYSYVEPSVSETPSASSLAIVGQMVHCIPPPPPVAVPLLTCLFNGIYLKTIQNNCSSLPRTQKKIKWDSSIISWIKICIA